MSLVRPGGLLLTCTCSAAVSHQSGLFRSYLSEAARLVGRHVTVIQELGAARDHPVNLAYPEGKYFTAYLLRVE
jgi:23S rRNA (cytosine1962-C5)-methyltransferase